MFVFIYIYIFTYYLGGVRHGVIIYMHGLLNHGRQRLPCIELELYLFFTIFWAYGFFGVASDDLLGIVSCETKTPVLSQPLLLQTHRGTNCSNGVSDLHPLCVAGNTAAFSSHRPQPLTQPFTRQQHGPPSRSTRPR